MKIHDKRDFQASQGAAVASKPHHCGSPARSRSRVPGVPRPALLNRPPAPLTAQCNPIPPEDTPARVRLGVARFAQCGQTLNGHETPQRVGNKYRCKRAGGGVGAIPTTRRERTSMQGKSTLCVVDITSKVRIIELGRAVTIEADEAAGKQTLATTSSLAICG